MTSELSAIRVRALPSDLGVRAVAAGVDEFGVPVEVRHDRAGGPLRCCLRDAGDGEGVVLLSVAPPGPRGAYAERGPVFVHAHDCGGPERDDSYPEDWRARPQVLRAYGEDGAIVGGEVVAVGGPYDEVARRLLGEPGVAVVHTRNVVFGCYMAAIERA